MEPAASAAKPLLDGEATNGIPSDSDLGALRPSEPCSPEPRSPEPRSSEPRSSEPRSSEPRSSALTPLSFERAIQRLGAIVESLEEGDQPLEESIALFEEGMALAKNSQEILDRAERRIEELLGVDAQGKPVVRELEPD